jgi:hypothetical protein
VPACICHHREDGHRLAANGALLSPQPEKRQELEGGKASSDDANEGRCGRDARDLEEDGPEQHDIAKEAVEVCCGQEIGEEQIGKVSKCEGGTAKSQKDLHDKQDLPQKPAFLQEGEESAGQEVVVGGGGGAAAGGHSLVVGIVAADVAAAPASITVGGKACVKAVAPAVDAAAAVAARLDLLAPLLESGETARLPHFLSHEAEETPSRHLHLQDAETDP